MCENKEKKKNNFSHKARKEGGYFNEKRTCKPERAEEADYKLSTGVRTVQGGSPFFPKLLEQLKSIPDPRHQSCIKYRNHVLLMSRILTAILYIGSMRKSSEELNCDTAIENLGYICGEKLEEAPYWETINNYLKRIDPEALQETVTEQVRCLIRSKAFKVPQLTKSHAVF